MLALISEFHVAILVFYASFNFPSTEVLVGEGYHIKGDQAEIIRPACRFRKAIWISAWWFSSCSSSTFQHMECNCLEQLRVPGGWAFGMGHCRGWDHLHPGADSLAEILKREDSHPHHGQVCGTSWGRGDLWLCADYSLCSFDLKAALVCVILQPTEAGPIDI